MDLKFRIWLCVLSLGVMASGEDIVAGKLTTGSSFAAVAGPPTDAPTGPVTVPPKKGSPEAILEDMKSRMLKSSRRSGPYRAECDSLCRVPSGGDGNLLSECKGQRFDKVKCPYYPGSANLNCYYCPTDRQPCTKRIQQTHLSLPWPCIPPVGSTHTQYSPYYNGYEQIDFEPACLTVSFTTRNQFNQSSPVMIYQRDCNDIPINGMNTCQSQEQEGTILTYCKCKGNLCNGGTRLGRSYYSIWTLGWGLIALLNSIHFIVVM